MKVILYADVNHLGEMGDVKNVASGYARNYLFPHMYAVPYNDETVKYFESRKEEIAERKEQKRKDAMSVKDKLESLVIELTVPASSNGKLYGSVSSQTIADYLLKNGFEIERKRIEIPGVNIKTTGSYHCVVHLYENSYAEVKIDVKGQIAETDKKTAKSEKSKKASEKSGVEKSGETSSDKSGTDKKGEKKDKTNKSEKQEKSVADTVDAESNSNESVTESENEEKKPEVSENENEAVSSLSSAETEAKNE